MPNTMIAPSILSADFGRLADELARLECADLIHLDIMDGHFVPNLTFGFPLVEAVRGLTRLPLDAHLMVTNPEDYVERLAELGVGWISFHQECSYHSHRLLRRIRELGCRAGLALNPAVPLSSLECILPELDYVLLMSVNPGFSGQSFIPAVLDKVASLRREIDHRRHTALIEVDGGINSTLAPELISRGADILVSASYIFEQEDYAAAIASLRG